MEGRNRAMQTANIQAVADLMVKDYDVIRKHCIEMQVALSDVTAPEGWAAAAKVNQSIAETSYKIQARWETLIALLKEE
jgi:hypothetical protein